MTDPAADLRALVAASRGADDPRDDDRARIRGALARKLGAATLATAATLSSSSAGAAITKTLAATAARYLVAVALTGAVGASAVAARRALAPPPSQHQRVAPAAPRASAPMARPAVAAVAPVAAPPIAPSAPTPAPTTTARPPRARASALDGVPYEDEPDIAAEVTALRDAHGAMEAGDPERALTILQGYASQHTGGALRIEREAARLIALCQAGRPRELDITSFLTHRASSPLAARVADACHRR